MSEEKTQLAPCRFCGTDDELKVVDKPACMVVCCTCGACGPFTNSSDYAIELWNDDAPAARLAALEAENAAKGEAIKTLREAAELALARIVSDVDSHLFECRESKALRAALSATAPPAEAQPT